MVSGCGDGTLRQLVGAMVLALIVVEDSLMERERSENEDGRIAAVFLGHAFAHKQLVILPCQQRVTALFLEPDI